MMQVKSFRDEIVAKIHDFVYQKNGGESTRTGDIIKSIPVFVTQAYCFFDFPNVSDTITNPEFKEIF